MNLLVSSVEIASAHNVGLKGGWIRWMYHELSELNQNSIILFLEFSHYYFFRRWHRGTLYYYNYFKTKGLKIDSTLRKKFICRSSPPNDSLFLVSFLIWFRNIGWKRTRNMTQLFFSREQEVLNFVLKTQCVRALNSFSYWIKLESRPLNFFRCESEIL